MYWLQVYGTSLTLCLSVQRVGKSKVDSASGGFVSDTLQRKLKDLEEENLSLRSEVICTHRDTNTNAQFKVPELLGTQS